MPPRPGIPKKLDVSFSVDIEELSAGRLLATLSLPMWGLLIFLAIGAVVSLVGIGLLWAGIAKASLGMAIAGGGFLAIGLVLTYVAIATFPKEARLSIKDESGHFSVTYLWGKKEALLPKSALRWVVCGHYWDNHCDMGDIRVALHFDRWPGDVAVFSVDLQDGGDGPRRKVINAGVTLAEAMDKADEISKALGIEHRIDDMQGWEAEHMAKRWGLA